jgi:hypothetical protein
MPTNARLNWAQMQCQNSIMAGALASPASTAMTLTIRGKMRNAKSPAMKAGLFPCLVPAAGFELAT